jgi:hypothetical protein
MRSPISARLDLVSHQKRRADVALGIGPHERAQHVGPIVGDARGHDLSVGLVQPLLFDLDRLDRGAVIIHE